MQPLVAWRAFQRLMDDPEDTAQVFRILRALSGNAVQRGYARFRRTSLGAQVLAERRDVLPLLEDRDGLGALPADSLGRAYLRFMETETLTPGGLVAASVEGEGDEYTDEGFALYGRRLRDTHDLWHVATGYGRDGFGELCLLAFSYAQTWNFGLAFIVLLGTRRVARAHRDVPAWRAVWQAYRAGRRAGWLPAADWEALLGRPLVEVRRELGLDAPSVYVQARTLLDRQPVAA